MRNALAIVAISGMAQFACAADSWTQTATGKDPSDADTTTTEYVVESSITQLRGNYRTAFVKTVFSPSVPGLDGRSVDFVISDVMVGCNDFSWGTSSKMAFDSNMVPVMAEVGEYVQSTPVWTIKGMGPLDQTSTTFKTAQFICSAPVRKF
ncbi:hypothetical protein APB26_32755 [Pseudomonas aeruginosa]|uniref:hypothetical protein n=1 Tax=Pseudomonas aeruginosa TaxID=287 RepID=UPI00071B4733|nr:hypothetical protein [Pseudomonas aeruginosa]KSQ21753.1 hypothetical protein APB26_32755 [Pseudomonas aeruginosa]RPV61426.1 hypothetical protein IPC838_19095 [Pseudomonas aeruginosa]